MKFLNTNLSNSVSMLFGDLFLGKEIFIAFLAVIGGILIHLITKRIDQKTKKRFDLSFGKPPHLHDKLVGRKSDVRKLRKKIGRAHNVWITSIGGIGKSTLAIYYTRKYKYLHKNIYWLSWKGTLEQTVGDLNNVTNGSDEDSNAILKKVLIFFREKVPRNDLLVIDGIDTYNSSDIAILNSIRCNVLFTTRVTNMDHNEYTLNELTDRQCYRLFKANYGGDIKFELFLDFIEKVGKHTLTIKLLGRYARYYSLAQLHQDIIDNDIDKIGYKMNIVDGEPNRKIISHLTQLYKIGFSDEKKKILLNLSLLPATDLNYDDIITLLGNEAVEGIESLRQLGWLVKRDKKTLYLHPVLSNTIRQIGKKEKQKASVYRKMMILFTQAASFSEDDFDVFEDKVRYLPYGMSICQHYPWQDIYLGGVLHHTANLLFIQSGDKVNPLSYAKDARKIYNAALQKRPNDLELLRKLGHLLSDMSEFYSEPYDNAIQCENTAICLKKQYPNNELDLLVSYSNLSLFHYYKKDVAYLKEAQFFLRNNQNVLLSSKKVTANFYNHLSLLYVLALEYNNAVTYAEYARDILEKNNAQHHYMYPLIINTLGGIYGYLLKESLKKDSKIPDKQLKAMRTKAFRYLYKSYHIKKKDANGPSLTLSTSQHNLATTYNFVGHNFHALIYARKALKIRQQYPQEILYNASSAFLYGKVLADLYLKYKIGWCRNKAINYLKKGYNLYLDFKVANPKSDIKNELIKCFEYFELLKVTI